MKELIRENKNFLALFLVWIVAGGFFLLFTAKGNEILWINSCHSPLLDAFFVHIYDYFGLNCAPPLFILVLFFALFLSYGRSLQLLVNSFSILYFIDLLHKYVFTSELNSRPTVFFSKYPLQKLETVFLNGQSGYPAASVAGTFAAFLLLSIYANDKRWSYPFFAVSFFYAISRLYVFQNFFDAVYVGSIIGVCSTMIFSFSLRRNKYYDRITWKDRSGVGDIKALLRFKKSDQ